MSKKVLSIHKDTHKKLAQIKLNLELTTYDEVLNKLIDNYEN